MGIPLDDSVKVIQPPICPKCGNGEFFLDTRYEDQVWEVIVCSKCKREYKRKWED